MTLKWVWIQIWVWLVKGCVPPYVQESKAANKHFKQCHTCNFISRLIYKIIPIWVIIICSMEIFKKVQILVVFKLGPKFKVLHQMMWKFPIKTKPARAPLDPSPHHLYALAVLQKHWAVARMELQRGGRQLESGSTMLFFLVYNPLLPLMFWYVDRWVKSNSYLQFTSLYFYRCLLQTRLAIRKAMGLPQACW